MWRQPNMMQQRMQHQNMMQQQNMNPQQMQRQRMMMHQQNMMQQNMMQQGMNPQQMQRQRMMMMQQQNMMQQQQQRNMMQQQQPDMGQQQRNMMQQQRNMMQQQNMQQQDMMEEPDMIPEQQQQDKPQWRPMQPQQQHDKMQQEENMQHQDKVPQNDSQEKMQQLELEEMMRLQENKTQQGDTMQLPQQQQQKMGQQQRPDVTETQSQMFSRAGDGYMGDKMGMHAPPPPPVDPEDAMAPNRGAIQDARSMEQGRSMEGGRSMERRNQSPQRRSRSRSPRRRPRSRSRDRFRGGDKSQDRRRRSRSQDRSRRSRSHDRGRRPRDGDRRDGERRDGGRRDGGEQDTREQVERQQEREKRELERQRRDEGLPPLKANNLSICTRTLWLGKLTSQTTEGDLRKELEKFGEVDSIRLIPPRGCAYVCLSQRKDAARALKDLPGSSMIRLKAAWAPGTGMKESTFKSNWDVDKGVTYVPWDKLATISIDALAAGGMVDDQSLPEHMKTAMAIKPMGIVPPHPKVASDMPPPVGMISVGGIIPGGPPPPPPREIPSQGPRRDNMDDRRPHGTSDRQFPPQMDMPRHLMAGQPPPPRETGRPDNERWSSNDAERRLDGTGRCQGEAMDERRNRFLPPGMTPDLSMDAQRSFLMANPRGDTSRGRPGNEEWSTNERDRMEGAGRHRDQEADDQRNYREYERNLAPGMNRSRFSGGEQQSLPFPEQQRPSRFGDTSEQQRPSRFGDACQVDRRSQNEGERMEGTDRRHGQDAGNQQSYGEYDRPPPGMNRSRFSGGEQDSQPVPDQQRPSRFGDTPSEQTRPSRFGDTPEQLRPSRFGDTPSEQSRPSRFGDTPQQPRPSRFGDTPQQSRPSRFGDTPEQQRPSRFGDTPEQSKPSRFGDIPDQPRPSRFGDTPQQSRPSRFGDTPEQRPSRFSDTSKSQPGNERGAPNQADRMAGADRSQMGYGDDRWNHKEGEQARQPTTSFPEQYTTNTRGDDVKRQMNPEQWSADRADSRAGAGQYQADYALEQRNYGDRSLPPAMDMSRPPMGQQHSFSRQQMSNPWSDSSKNPPDSEGWSSGKAEQMDSAGQYQGDYGDDQRNYRDGRQEMPRMSHSGQHMPPARGDTSNSRPDHTNRDRMDGTGQGEEADDPRYRRDDNRFFQPPPSFSQQQMGNPRGDTRDRMDGSGQRQAEYAGDRRNFGGVENPFRALMNKPQPQQRMPSSQLENEWQYPEKPEQRDDPGRYQGRYAAGHFNQRGGDRFAREAPAGEMIELEDASKHAAVSRPPMTGEDTVRPPQRPPPYPGAPGAMGPGPGFRGAPGQPFPAGQVPSLMSMPPGAPRTGGPPPRSNDKDRSSRDRGDPKANTVSSGRDDSRSRSSKEKQFESKNDSTQRGRRDAPSWQR